MTRGRFITFEGIDGAGKSTCLEFVRAWLQERGLSLVTTREPGGTAAGEAIRRLLLDKNTRICADTEALLMFAARAEHLEVVVRPALSQASWVLCDRFTDATYAYQGGGRGIAFDRLDTLRDWVQQGLEPDLTVLVDVDPGIASKRLEGRGGEADRFELEARQFHERVRGAYLELAARSPARIRIVDSTASVEEVQERLRPVLEELLR